MNSKTFIIDGNNVVYYNSKQPQLHNLLTLRNELIRLGDVIVIVSHELQFRIDDKKGLQSGINKKILLETPKGADVDLYILETARKTNGYIISNDSFKQYESLFQPQISNRLPFMIIKLPQGGHQPILPWARNFLITGGKMNESTILNA